jgi:hypothetical protein
MSNPIMEIGSGFNWITPATAFIQDILNGPASHFGIPALSSWDKRGIKRLLTQHGIKVWGLMYTLDMETLMFSVPKTKAQWAYLVLEKEGVPILYAPSEVVNSSTTRHKRNPSTRKARKTTDSTSLLDRFFDFLDGLDKAAGPP